MKKEVDKELNSCEVCTSAAHKYKCPSCHTKYCSLSCFKTHKEEGEISGSDEESGDEDRVSGHILDKLGNSQELCNMLHNKHLREMIKEIDSSEDPGKLLTQAMQIPIFTEFVDECLRIVEPQDENKMEV
ncbi:zinc finger HIT domain-containing protein 3-like isoform X3 [Porites lutea]|uniref:zinc finger HIT domain-containing protein 3-like isoform X3 n=1 Tax=Porites lutea TaxID=51062 RepID=UPI003CC5ECC9